MDQICYCCLAINTKELSNFTTFDSQIYYELTKIKIIDKENKVCARCKLKLIEFSDFNKLCIESHIELNNRKKQDVLVKQEKKYPNRKNNKILKKEPLKVNEAEFEHADNNNDSSDDENIAISVLQQKIQNKQLKVLVEKIPSAVLKTEPERTSNIIQAIEFDLKVEQVVPKISKANKYLCSECGSSFATSQRLRVHSLVHTGERNHPCTFQNCDKKFSTEFRLRAHTRVHSGEKPFACDYEGCGLKFAQGNALKCHRRIHTKERPYECTFCHKRFSQNTILKTHMTLHTGKTIPCDFPGCDKKFARTSFLILHRRDHTNERKYTCEKCSKQYKQKSHLDRHYEATHLGIKHKCEYTGCNKEFTKSWSLKQHTFSHDNEKPYKCDFCKSAFIRKDKLKKHVIKSHPSNEKSSENREHEKDHPEFLTVSDQIAEIISTGPPNTIFTIQNEDGTVTEVQTLATYN